MQPVAVEMAAVEAAAARAAAGCWAPVGRLCCAVATTAALGVGRDVADDVTLPPTGTDCDGGAWDTPGAGTTVAAVAAVCDESFTASVGCVCCCFVSRSRFTCVTIPIIWRDIVFMSASSTNPDFTCNTAIDAVDTVTTDVCRSMV